MSIEELNELVMDKVLGRPKRPVTKSTEGKLIDEFKRGGLGEGRSYGLGFSIVDKLSNGDYKALMAFTACKDYLNDFVYVESTGNALGEVHGFKHNYVGAFKGKDYFYPAFRPVNHLGGSKYVNFEKVEDSLKNNYKNIIAFLNKLEKELKVENLSEFESYIDKTLIIKTSMFWAKYPFLFSMYGLLVRCFLNVTEEELKGDIIKTIIDKKTLMIPEDGSLLQSIKAYLPNLNRDKLLNYSYPATISPDYIHNFGIVGRLYEVGKVK